MGADYHWNINSYFTRVNSRYNLKCMAKFRYRQEDQAVNVKVEDDGSTSIFFKEPQRAVTPGQYAVLYLGDICLGGGKIVETFK